MLAWNVLAALNPEVGSVKPLGRLDDVHGMTTAVAEVLVLQYRGPEGPPSP